MTVAKPRIVVYDAPEGHSLQVDDVVIMAGIPTEVTADIADRIKDRDDVEVTMGGDPPAQNTGGTPANQEGSR